MRLLCAHSPCPMVAKFPSKAGRNPRSPDRVIYNLGVSGGTIDLGEGLIYITLCLRRGRRFVFLLVFSEVSHLSCRKCLRRRSPCVTLTSRVTPMSVLMKLEGKDPPSLSTPWGMFIRFKWGYPRLCCPVQ